MLETPAEQARISDIYYEYEPVMLRHALLLARNKEMAEDAVHNAFLAIIKHKEKLFSLSERELKTQVVIFTKNKCIDMIRKDKPLVDNPIHETGDILESNDIPIEDQIIMNDEFESIRRHMRSLDETSRLVLEMKYLLGMSYKEIGEALNMTPKHVDTRIMRSKEKVRKLAEGGEPVER